METKVESIVEQIHALNDTMGKLAAELEALVNKLAQLPEQKIGDQKPYQKSPEWRILEFMNYRDGCIWIRSNDGYYIHGDSAPRAEHIFLNTIKTGQSVYCIRKVRRLSDGEVFTVGDETDKGVIEKFILHKDNTLLAMRPHGCFPVSYLQKPERKALFTTEDGVEVYYGDKYYFLSKNNWEVHSVNATLKEIGAYDLELKRYVVFSTREKAEEYAKMHQPRYSLDQLMKTFKSARKTITSKELYQHFQYKDFDDYFHGHR